MIMVKGLRSSRSAIWDLVLMSGHRVVTLIKPLPSITRFHNLCFVFLFTLDSINASLVTISKRLNKTRDWIVAIKAFLLIHRLLLDAHPAFQDKIMHSTRLDTSRILNMSNFKDDAHSNSSDQVGFVRVYSLYHDAKVDFVAYRRKLSNGVVESVEFRDEFGFVERERERNEVTPVREMGDERVLKRLNRLLWMLDRVLGCRPSRAAKNNSLVLVALYQVVRDSFKLYAEVCDVLGVLLDRFSPRWSMSIMLLDRCSLLNLEGLAHHMDKCLRISSKTDMEKPKSNIASNKISNIATVAAANPKHFTLPLFLLFLPFTITITRGNHYVNCSTTCLLNRTVGGIAKRRRNRGKVRKLQILDAIFVGALLHVVLGFVGSSSSSNGWVGYLKRNSNAQTQHAKGVSLTGGPSDPENPGAARRFNAWLFSKDSLGSPKSKMYLRYFVTYPMPTSA
ncbi:hypothetical protein JHK87_009986 [Glycine soja]|nr:hypothetical protein JHK87_009986 [Glycine soja]